MTAPTTSELIERLRSAHMPTPVDPNAVYRTRPLTLFQEAADRLADLEREREGWRPDREAIARIIDPAEWALDDVGRSKEPPVRALFLDASLAKADAILALPPSMPMSARAGDQPPAAAVDEKTAPRPEPGGVEARGALKRLQGGGASGAATKAP